MTFGFSVYKFSYEKNMQETKYNFEVESSQFDLVYKKISLIEKSIIYQAKNCDSPIDKNLLEKNLIIISQAKKLLVENKIKESDLILKNIDNICESFDPEINANNFLRKQSIILLIVWILLIILFIKKLIIIKR